MKTSLWASCAGNGTKYARAKCKIYELLRLQNVCLWNVTANLYLMPHRKLQRELTVSLCKMWNQWNQSNKIWNKMQSLLKWSLSKDLIIGFIYSVSVQFFSLIRPILLSLFVPNYWWFCDIKMESFSFLSLSTWHRSRSQQWPSRFSSLDCC